MYREAGIRSSERAELVYVPPPDAALGRKHWLVGALIGLPITVCVAVSLLVSPAMSIVAFIVTAAALYIWYRRQPDDNVVLSVDDGILTLRGAQPSATIRLDDLLDVTLDKRPEERIEYGTSANTALQAIGGRYREIKPTHVVLVCRGATPIKLGKSPILEMQATEWMGKVRAFLRKSDWVPEDERAPVSSAVPSSA